MKELLKNQRKNFILVAVYMVVALTVYIVCAHSIWGKWWVDIIAAVIVIIPGCIIGYTFIRDEEKARIAKLEKEQEIVSEPEEEKEDDSRFIYQAGDVQVLNADEVNLEKTEEKKAE